MGRLTIYVLAVAFIAGAAILLSSRDEPVGGAAPAVEQSADRAGRG